MQYWLLFLWLLSCSALAQRATIRETTRSMITYPFSDPDPVARPGRFYPYFRFDGYTDKGKPQNWKLIELENDYIRLAIAPEIGGKVWGAYEKSRGFAFIYFNHVVKFRDVAMRGAWTSGGIEFNFGDFGHAATTSTPVDYLTRTNADGSVSCFIGATDWSGGTTWRVEIRLEPDKAYFTTRSWWSNSSPLEQSYYHWTNAGFKAAGKLETVFPGSHYIGHVGEYDTWPLDSIGRKIAWYEQNDFGTYKSYHVLGKPTNFYGGYWHQDNMGFGHWSPYHEKLGKKVWIWGLAREGMIWEKLLTDTDGQYVELQSGRLFNQASPGSITSPFKHVGFKPYSADTWTEYWFPVKETRGLTHTSPHGALNLRVENDWLKWDWMALEKGADTLKILAAGKPLVTKKLTLKPMQTVRDSVQWQGNTEQLVVRLGAEVLTDDPGPPLERPLKAPTDFNWDSEYGLLLKGTDLSQQRNYAEAETVLNQALQKNPHLAPALTQLAQIRYRQGAYAECRELARRALAVHTYDPEANYFWGLSAEQTGHEADALDGFSVAALSPAFRPAALLRLAYLAARKGDWAGAATLVTQCLEVGPQNEAAHNLRAMILRESGAAQQALAALDEQLRRDPLNHAAQFEYYLNTGQEADKKRFVDGIRQELPHETFLDLALHYHQLHRPDEALRMLELAPAHPMVQLWQAYLFDQTKQMDQSTAALSRALAASPTLVFPFRPATATVLQWAQKQKPHWRWNYYEALIRWQHNQIEQAQKQFLACGTEPNFAPFYLAKAELFAKDTAVAHTALETAYRLDPTSWRTGWKLAKFYADHQQLTKAVGLAEKKYKSHPESYVLGLQYARMLRLTNRYADALTVLERVSMLPAEGAKDAHGLYRETNLLQAVEWMKAKKWREAVRYLQKAETWPENLGSGAPFRPDNRLTQFLLAYCYDQLRNRAQADRAYAYLQAYQNRDGPTPTVANKLAALSRQEGRNYKTITRQLLAESPGRDGEVLKNFLTVL